MNPFEFLNSINVKKNNLMVDDDPDIEKEYLPYLMNNMLSNFSDTVFQANEMNMNYHLDNKLQYDFLRSIIRKRKRFKKKDVPFSPESLKIIQEYYGYSQEKAKDVLDLHTKSMIESMKKYLNKGGLKP
jgi:hypothetical protein